MVDRAEITDVFVRYCTALRTKDLALFDEIFSSTPSSTTRGSVGSRTGVERTKAWLSELLAGVRSFELYVGDSEFEFAADRRTATVRQRGTASSFPGTRTQRCRSTGITRTGWSARTAGSLPNGSISRRPGSSFPLTRRWLAEFRRRIGP